MKLLGCTCHPTFFAVKCVPAGAGTVCFIYFTCKTLRNNHHQPANRGCKNPGLPAAYQAMQHADMHQERLVLFLQRNNLIGPEKAREIAGQFQAFTIAKNEFFLKEGRISNEYLFLSQGFMRAFAYDTEGNDVTTSFYAPNQVVFEVSSFFTRTPSRENIQALADCAGWMINFEQLNKLFHGLPEFREFGRHILVAGYTALKARMLSMITDTAEERYALLLHTNPTLLQNAPLKHIASYLGITDTSLSRIRKDLAGK